MSDELKPCPFCGEPAIMDESDHALAGVLVLYQAGCADMDCPGYPAVGLGDRAQAVERWNRRTSLPPSEMAEGEADIVRAIYEAGQSYAANALKPAAFWEAIKRGVAAGAARERAAVVAYLKPFPFVVASKFHFGGPLEPLSDAIARGDHLPAAPPEQVTGPTKEESEPRRCPAGLTGLGQCEGEEGHGGDHIVYPDDGEPECWTDEKCQPEGVGEGTQAAGPGKETPK